MHTISIVVPVNKTRRDCFLLRDDYYYKGICANIMHILYIYSYKHIYYNKGRLDGPDHDSVIVTIHYILILNYLLK